MKAIAPHLYSRNGHLYYRVSLPSDLAPIFQKREVIVSLGTKDTTQARFTGAQLDLLYTQALASIRASDEEMDTPLVTEEIQKLKDTLDKANTKIKRLQGKKNSSVNQTHNRLFSEVWPIYLENCKTERLKTKDHKKRTFELFQSIIGDKPISVIGRPDVREFLNQLPKVSSKGENKEPISPSTINTRLSGLNSLFNWLDKTSDGKIQNPFKGTKVKEDSNKKRATFKGDDILSLFNSPIYKGCSGLKFTDRLKGGNEIIQDSLFWVPLIGYYSGMRLNEICQLHVDDIQCSDGTWYFDLNQQDGKKLKTLSSQRKVPIHFALIEQGFIEFVQSQKLAQSRRVFSDLKPGPYGNYGFYFTKRFNLLLKALGIKRQGLCFHSFRHTFIDNLKEAGVERAIAMALCGHSGGKTVHDMYGSGFSLKVLKASIDKISRTKDSTNLG